MRTETEVTAIVKLEFSNPIVAQSVLDRWSRTSGASLKIRRARVTSEDARFELEIRGHELLVATIVRQSAPWDASRRFPNPAPMGALA